MKERVTSLPAHPLLQVLQDDNNKMEQNFMKDAELKHLTPEEAYRMLHDKPNSVLLDIRSTTEYLLVGHPIGAVHIPWIDEPDWLVDKNFVTNVRKVLLGGVAESSEPVPVILICRSGKRSLDAGEVLVKSGFPEVYNVLEGFEGELDENRHRGTKGGWKFHGLPWEQT